jgi:hypothetical protein
VSRRSFRRLYRLLLTWPQRHSPDSRVQKGHGLVLSGLAPPAPATLAAVHGLAPHPCNPTTAGVLDALGVPPAAVRSIYYERPPIGNSHGIVEQGYTAWVRLADQPGDLVIRHDDWCGFVTSYTVGTVRLGTR